MASNHLDRKGQVIDSLLEVFDYVALYGGGTSYKHSWLFATTWGLRGPVDKGIGVNTKNRYHSFIMLEFSQD